MRVTSREDIRLHSRGFSVSDGECCRCQALRRRGFCGAAEKAAELLRFRPLCASGRCPRLGFGACSGLRGSFFELESDFSGGLEFEEGRETFSFFGDEAAEEVGFTGGAKFV